MIFITQTLFSQRSNLVLSPHWLQVNFQHSLWEIGRCVMCDQAALSSPTWIPAFFLLALLVGVKPASGAGTLTAIDDSRARGPHPRTDKPEISAGSTLYYSSGSYSTSSETQISELSSYAQYRLGNAKFRLTLPYISIETTRQIVSRSNVIGQRSTVEKSTGRSGWGDVTLDAEYTIQTKNNLPSLIPYSSIKLGTASTSKGLSTGKNDYELGLGFAGPSLSGFYPFGQLGYRFVGQPERYRLKDHATYELGVGYSLGQRNYLSAMFSGHQSSQPRFAAAAHATVVWNYSLKLGNGFQVYVVKGLSNGSPDVGVGIGGYFRF